MAIQISSDGRTFTLQTEKSSYQMMADAHDVLLHLYYGRKNSGGESGRTYFQK